MAVPATITGVTSSTPTVGTGKTGAVILSDQVKAYQQSLVPAGLADYRPDDVALDLTNSFINQFEAGWGGVTLQREGRLVIIQGLVTRATAWADYTTIALIPAPLRPKRRELGQGVDAFLDGSLQVQLAGAANERRTIKIAYLI